MARFKLLLSLLVLIGVCSLARTSFAAPKNCNFNGDYSFFFWYPPDSIVSGVGFFSVQLDPATQCRSGVVLPGGILNCNIGFPVEEDFEDFIEGGSVFLESDGEGTMLIETNSSDGICDTGDEAIELDVSVVQGGKRVLFNADGEQYAGSGLIPQAGYYATVTGRADKCFAGQISGCYNLRFWTSFPPEYSTVGDCTICVNGAGGITGGSCRCNAQYLVPETGIESFETLSEIEGGGYTLGESCQSSTGYLWIATSSDEICDLGSYYMALDFAVAQGGEEIIGACDTAEYILNNESEFNVGFYGCAFEGYQQ